MSGAAGMRRHAGREFRGAAAARAVGATRSHQASKQPLRAPPPIAARILVGQDAAHREGAPDDRQRTQIAGEHRGGIGIVRDVENPGGLVRPGSMIWKRPTSRTARRPRATAAAGTGSRGASSSSAAIAVAALPYWASPASAGGGRSASVPARAAVAASRSPPRAIVELDAEPLERARRRAAAVAASTGGSSRLPSTAGAAGAEDAGLLARDGLERVPRNSW